MIAPRRVCRDVALGRSGVVIGGLHPIAVQSMTATQTTDVLATARQIEALAAAGCEVVRVTVNSMAAAEAVAQLRNRCPIALVADIHYDYRLALAVAPHVDKIRINPGNIGNEERVRAVVQAAQKYDLAIRIGVNAGSLERDTALRHGAELDPDDGMLRPPQGGYPAQALVESALYNVEVLERFGFRNTVISVKANHVPLMVQAYRLLAGACAYPLHLGVTEAGLYDDSCIKSAMGIGALLMEGIGDTVRVSIAGRDDADKVNEVTAGYRILRAAGVRKYGVEVVACPTCGRQQGDINTAEVARRVEQQTAHIRTPLKVAVMGCAVNGPGEAADADLALVAAANTMRLYRAGKPIETELAPDDAVRKLVAMITAI